MTLSAFLAAWALHLVAAASPGPAVLMAARTGVTEGFRTGLWLSIGMGFGALTWAMAALFGLAFLFQLVPALFWVMKIAGGLFLAWIGYKMWRHAHEPLPEADIGAAPRSYLSALRRGLITQLSNPKPAIFFSAVFVGTVPPGTSPAWLAALLVAIFINEVTCTALVARLFSIERCRRAYSHMKTGIDRSFGGILALLGMKIAII